MSDDPACQAQQAPTGAVPRTCVPFAHVPAVPVVAVPYVPVPVPSGMPVLSVAGVLPDRTGNVDVTRFLEAAAAAALAGKADKAVPAAAGNLASLGADGNLADSGATPASIKAAAVAEVVANAPGTMDTLKEIADILGSSQQSGTVLKRISDLESGKVDNVAGKGLSSEDFTTAEKQKLSGLSAQVPADWGQADAAAPDFIKNKPAIPGPVDVSGKLDGAAACAAWVPQHAYHAGEAVFHNGSLWESFTDNNTSEPGDDSGNWFETTIADLKQDALTSTQLSNIADVPNKAPLASPAFTGAPTAPTAAPGTNTTQVATTAFVAGSLPYSLVVAEQTGDWQFSDGETHTISVYEYDPGGQYPWAIVADGITPIDNVIQFQTKAEADAELEALTSCSFVGDGGSDVTATRASLPGHLCDRAGNRVVVTGATTLTLPAAVPGYLRDFLVRLEISGSTVPTITFAAPTGETITYETDGDEFPVPDEAGDWLYSFTESCVAHKFVVSLKKVNEVAAPQAQGGS